MNYPLRSIAFVADLLFPPKGHQVEDLQRTHGVMFNDPECRYQNFQIVPGGARLTNPAGRQGVVSSCTFLHDRVQVREEMTGIGREDFRSRLLRIAQVTVSNLRVPVFIIRQFVVRSLINPRHFEDSRKFLSSSIMTIGSEDFIPLGREPHLVGIRFAFQAASADDGFHNLRVESYVQDPRSLFLEDVASFRKPVAVESLDAIGSDFDAAYSFLEDNVVPFVAQFDRAP